MKSQAPMINDDEILTAAQALLAGKLVAFPTETVYGLGADADQVFAIEQVYALKKRPAQHPLIVHVAQPSEVVDWVRAIPLPAQRLLQSPWMPGPLTLVLSRSDRVLPAVCGGQDSVAIRCPSHPVACRLIQKLSELAKKSKGLVAPSANLFGQISPSHHDHVIRAFCDTNSNEPNSDRLHVIRAGACSVGIESTIVDAREPDRLVILRHGILTAAELGEWAKVPVYHRHRSFDSGVDRKVLPRVSGDCLAHYAPHTPLRLFDSADLRAQILQSARTSLQAPKRVVWYFSSSAAALAPAKKDLSHWVWQCMPDDPKAFAACLYAQLHQADQSQSCEIWIELSDWVRRDESWLGVIDRLTRAAANFSAAESGAHR